MVHQYQLNGYNIVLDTCSGSVHVVDDVAYDVIAMYQDHTADQIVSAMMDKYGSRPDVTEEDLRQCIDDVTSLKEAGKLWSPDVYENMAFDFKNRSTVVKALCLHVAHDCNLRCGYCFADTGDFGGHRALMSKEVAQKAIEFAIKGSKKRHNLELDLFGGEPLMNMPVVKFIVDYVRKREKETGKNIKLTLTTNGTLLTDEIVTYLNDNRVMLVLSLDGSKKTHDHMRPYPGHLGSFDKAVEGFKKVIESRRGRNYYLRGTYTHYNPHFADDVLAMLEVGSEISMEPVVGTNEPYVLTEDDWQILDKEYEKLARIYLDKRRKGIPFDFFHFNVALDNGPCVAKRLAGCGAGHEYYAITPEGDIYPCHQFVGREQYKMGTLDMGIVKKDMVQYFRHMHVMKKEECRTCWARFFCSGGCHANADLVNGTIEKPYEYGCKIQRKRLEMAIIVQALLTEDVREGKKDERPVIDNFKYQVDE